MCVCPPSSHTGERPSVDGPRKTTDFDASAQHSGTLLKDKRLCEERLKQRFGSGAMYQARGLGILMNHNAKMNNLRWCEIICRVPMSAVRTWAVVQKNLENLQAIPHLRKNSGVGTPCWRKPSESDEQQLEITRLGAPTFVSECAHAGCICSVYSQDTRATVVSPDCGCNIEERKYRTTQQESSNIRVAVPKMLVHVCPDIPGNMCFCHE